MVGTAVFLLSLWPILALRVLVVLVPSAEAGHWWWELLSEPLGCCPGLPVSVRLRGCVTLDAGSVAQENCLCCLTEMLSCSQGRSPVCASGIGHLRGGTGLRFSLAALLALPVAITCGRWSWLEWLKLGYFTRSFCRKQPGAGLLSIPGASPGDAASSRRGSKWQSPLSPVSWPCPPVPAGASSNPCSQGLFLWEQASCAAIC